MSKFEATVKMQLEAHHRISRLIDNMKKLGKEKISLLTIRTRLEALESHWKTFQANHTALVAAKTEELKNHDYFVNDLYELCETSYFATKDELLALKDNLASEIEDKKDSSLNSTSEIVHSSATRALPKISLPKFNGDYHTWLSFRDLFTSMIVKNNEITMVEKLHYLKNHVTGEAARRISNLAITAENFSRAWDALVSRYENKRVLVNAYFDQLFRIKPLPRKSADDLKDLLATVKEVLGGLRSLGAPIGEWDYFIVYLIAKNLDLESREAWELHQGNSTEPATFAELENFLEGRTRALEMVAPSNVEKNGRAQKTKVGIKSSARVNAASVASIKCVQCSEAHYISRCPTFLAKSILERREIVKEKKLCFNCLGAHRLSECRTTKRCHLCNRHHHTLIHGSGASSDSTLSYAHTAAASGSQSSATSGATALSSNNLVAKSNHVSGSTTLLATAMVNLISPYGQCIEARALIDQGSELSLVSESLAQWLKLSRRQAKIPILGIGSRSAGFTRGVTTLRIRSRVEPYAEFNVIAYILPRLTSSIPSTPIEKSTWPHISGLKLADPSFAVPGKIDLVLGADILGSLLRPSIRSGSAAEPTAQETELGWILFGPTNASTTKSNNTSSSRALNLTPDQELASLLQKFWCQEEIPSIKVARLTADEQSCEEHFAKTHSRDSSGRYIVRLPFRASYSMSGSSYSTALRMLRRTQTRFRAEPEFSRLYTEFLQEYEALKHMSRVTPHPNETGYYLPHHGILRDSSTTTRLRVVFNGSCKTSTGIALNECLHIGPKLQNEIADVLLRWRLHAYVFCADIAKMYRQILINKLDRRWQKILWSSSGPPVEYELNTVTYGLSCAPYLALRVLQQLAKDEGSRYEDASDILLHDTYVDDVLSGADTIPLARKKAAELRKLLMAGGFQLHKWASNEAAVLPDIDACQQADDSTREFSQDDQARALGLSWQPSSDMFEIQPFRVSAISSVPSKRTVLSRIAQIFDPLGWISPVTVTAKMMMQELWKANLDWDDPLPNPYLLDWKNFEQTLRASHFRIPRWLGCSKSSVLELHGFSDASQQALGAVVYMRTLDECGRARISLLSAKSKVAPLKKVTIPRLELSAAVLLARLIFQVQRALNLKDLPVHCWIDSTVALTWIKAPPSRWKEFVANRVTYIQDLLPKLRWHHVSGQENPADCASRGLTPEQLANHKLWWNGPPWLQQPSPSWPSDAPSIDPAQDLEEKASRINLTVAQIPQYWNLADRYSKFIKLIRVTAWIFRAVSQFKKHDISALPKSLTADEINKAETFWIKHIQYAFFASEIVTLTRNRTLPPSHPFLRLAPFIDAHGLLRVGGRLRNSLLDPDVKHPLLLPRDSPITRLILDEYHTKTLHGGVQVMLAVVRQKFWILGGRAPISAFVRKCVRCVRYRAVHARELMGQLPSTRVTPSRSFLHTGVDYAGPFLLKTWRGRTGRTYKGFLVVFICFATSAVHLELATDYSAAGFIAAYKRFAGRRGVCASLHSDCGTNFVGADAELRRLFDAASSELCTIANHLASSGTQ